MGNLVEDSLESRRECKFQIFCFITFSFIIVCLRAPFRRAEDHGEKFVPGELISSRKNVFLIKSLHTAVKLRLAR